MRLQSSPCENQMNRAALGKEPLEAVRACSVGAKFWFEAVWLRSLASVTFSGQTTWAEGISSSEILRCYYFWGFCRLVINVFQIASLCWQRSRAIDPKSRRPGSAGSKGLVAHQLWPPFRLCFQSSPLPVFCSGSFFLARSMDRTQGALTRAARRGPSSPVPCCVGQVKTALKPGLVAGGKNYFHKGHPPCLTLHGCYLPSFLLIKCELSTVISLSRYETGSETLACPRLQSKDALMWDLTQVFVTPEVLYLTESSPTCEVSVRAPVLQARKLSCSVDEQLARGRTARSW